MSSTDKTESSSSSGGLLGLAKSVLGFADKEKLSEPIDMSKAETVDKTNEKGSLKDTILQKADELLDHNPEVEKSSKVNVQTDKGMEVSEKKGTKTHVKTQHKVDKSDKGRKIKEAEDVDEMDKDNEMDKSSADNSTGGLTGKLTSLVSSAASVVESTVESIAEKTLGHERTETLKNKATGLLENVNLFHAPDAEESTVQEQVTEKANQLKKDLKEKVGPAKARLNAIKTTANKKVEETKGDKKVNKNKEKDEKSSAKTEEKHKEQRTTADGVSLTEEDKDDHNDINISSSSGKQLPVGRAAARHRKKRKAKLAKMHSEESDSKENLHGGKNKSEEKSDMKSEQKA